MTAKDQRTGDRHTGPRQRSVRGIDDELWQAAKEKAEREGTDVSKAIRKFIERWART